MLVNKNYLFVQIGLIFKPLFIMWNKCSLQNHVNEFRVNIRVREIMNINWIIDSDLQLNNIYNNKVNPYRLAIQGTQDNPINSDQQKPPNAGTPYNSTITINDPLYKCPYHLLTYFFLLSIQNSNYCLNEISRLTELIQWPLSWLKL